MIFDPLLAKTKHVMSVMGAKKPEYLQAQIRRAIAGVLEFSKNRHYNFRAGTRKGTRGSRTPLYRLCRPTHDRSATVPS